jgi:hypothetical protein
MKRRIRRILICISLATIASIGILVALILYPQNLFADKIDYKNLRIYANGNIGDDYQPVFDKALELITDSELYEKMTFEVFLANNSLYKEIDTMVFGYAIARSIDNNVILRVDVNFRDNLLLGPKNRRNLAKTVAHELVHCLQLNRYGVLKFNPLFPPETWILEGYPEYIANRDERISTGYRLTDSIKKLREFEQKGSEWIETEPGQFDPLNYFKSRIMIEYLIDIKHMTYAEIIKVN